MKTIIAVLALTATIASATVIDLPAPITYTITVTQAEYSVDNYNTDNGTWLISVRLMLTAPQLVDAEIRIDTWKQIEVTSAEISTAAGLAEGVKPSEVMTGAEITTAVMSVAFTKALTAYGVSQ